MDSSSPLLRELAQARAQTDHLFSVIDPAAIYDRPIAERHRMIFYRGHLEAFDWNQMKFAGMPAKSPQPEFDKLFERGIDPEPGQLPHDGPADWPSIEEVDAYNQRVRDTIDRELPQVPEDIAHLMIEHRHMHAETFAYIVHNLDPEKKRGPEPQLNGSHPVRGKMVRVPAGMATLGRDPDQGFGWDNEYRKVNVFVPEFSIGEYKVTNGEYLGFVKQGASVPHYWLERDGLWFYRGMFGNVPLPLDWPVYATLDQARAYATWKDCEIATEPQFHRAAFGDHADVVISENANLDYRSWDPVPVDAAPEIENPFGISQMVGNGWEWTSTVFAPFEGFTPRPSYPTYSANFFDGKHYVMKGASPRTSAKLVRRSLRNWFRSEYPYVYATFRLIRNS